MSTIDPIKKIPREYYDYTVDVWIRHTVSLGKGIPFERDTHTCGFCEYINLVASRVDSNQRCTVCPAFGICKTDPGYWLEFVHARTHHDIPGGEQFALAILEWLYDYKQEGNVIE